MGYLIVVASGNIYGRKKLAVDFWTELESNLNMECERDTSVLQEYGSELPSGFTYFYSRWSDYDAIYQLNDFLVSTGACPGDWEYYKDYA